MKPGFLSRLADIGLKARAALGSRIRTLAAQQHAVLGSGTRLGAEGKVVNIGKETSAITVGCNGLIRGELLTFAHAGRIEVGDWFYLGPGSTIWSSSDVGIKIGSRVLISHGVHIHDTNSHPLSASSRFELTKAILTTGHPRDIKDIVAFPVSIADDVWIGFGATILKGVTISEGAIVAASAVVTKDVEPWTIVAGNPARVIRQLAPGPALVHQKSSS